MQPYNLSTRIIMRNDTLENWRKNNPVLMKGEVGCAIDDARGVVTYKVGDGVHKWTELSLIPGEAERTNVMEAAQTSALKVVSERMKDHQEKTTKSNLNPYLEDFEIPHYDFEDTDIKNLIDF